jgi:Zn-finger nucleic acid-binding protein
MNAMAADLYEKCLICDGKGRLDAIRESNKELPPCPECEGIGFMLVGMTVGELEQLQGETDKLKRRAEFAENDRDHFKKNRDEWYAITEEHRNEIDKLRNVLRQRIRELGEANVRGDRAEIPVVGDRVRSKATGTIGTIERVFRGDPAGFQPNKVLVDIRHDHGGHAYNFDPKEFESIN